MYGASANAIYSAIRKQKKLKVRKIVRMGFDEAKAFSETKTGVQAQIKCSTTCLSALSLKFEPVSSLI